MVADNPFTQPRVPPPALILPEYSTRSDSPPSHPNQMLGARTPRRVQWTQDHVINVPDSNEKEAEAEAEEDVEEEMAADAERMEGVLAPDLAHVNRALEGFGRDEEDYDYRLDPDPGEVEIEPGYSEEETIHKLLKPEGADNMSHHVQLGETDGLPTYYPEEGAAKLVSEHMGRGKWSSIRRRVRSGSVARKGRGEEVRGDEEKRPPPSERLAPISEGAGDSGTEARVSANPPLQPPPRQAGMPHLPGGTSVLSSLLALYNSQHLESGNTSAATTPQSSRPPSPEKEEERGRGRAKKRSKSPWRRRDSSEKGETPPSTPDFDHKHRTKSNSSLIHSVSRAVHDFRDDRPRQARSGAGVFGALVANTASMAAVAAPSSSTLVPSATKPGYHLNRYSLRESPPLPSPPRVGSGFNFGSGSRLGSAVGLNSMRDRSESPSRPASWFSTETKDEARRNSADNVIEMKSRKRKPRASPLNLKPGRNVEKQLVSPSPEVTEDERRRREWESEKKRRKKAKEARKKQEVYIIQHVAAILSRQQFILKLARALMMFGSPTHRLETQIQATAKVLDINAQVVYLPNIMLVSFADDSTHTSETKFLKQATGLDLGKLLATHELYWEVIHDRMSVEDAGRELDRLMTMPPCYNAWQMILIAGFCSGIIVITSYYGSILDAFMAAPLGMLLQAVQIIALKNDLFSGVFEIVIATVISFLAAVLASSHYFCYTALVSGGIVLILPGFIVLSGALELASRNITSGAVRMGYSVIYSLFLGFGISIGSEIYVKIRGLPVTNATNNTCDGTHYDGAPWYLIRPSPYWYFLTVPLFSFFLSLNLQQPLRGRTGRRELPVMIAFASAGWVTNYFAGRAFPGRSDIVSAIGSFCVGILGNLYGRISKGASFPVMVTGILMQLPSGLKEGGLFNFANETSGGSVSQYSTGFRVAGQLVSVAIGLTVGLFVAAVITHPLGGSKRRGAGIFSF